ncbi:MAG: chorismate mutase [Oscillospiraceae bacterium]
MDRLQRVRAQIDKVDRQMATLFESRMALAAQLATCKKAEGLPVLDAARHKEIIVKNTAQLKNKDLKKYYTSFITHVMTLSRHYQTQLIGQEAVAYTGREKGPAFRVLKALFPEAEPLATAGLKEVFEAVAAGMAAFGVVPFEVSGQGKLAEIIELSCEHPCYFSDMADIVVKQGVVARYLVLSHQAPVAGSHISLLATMENQVGHLAQLIETLTEKGFKIEAVKARPAGKKSPESTYYLELSLPNADEMAARTEALLHDVGQLGVEVRVLGLYGSPRLLTERSA